MLTKRKQEKKKVREKEVKKKLLRVRLATAKAEKEQKEWEEKKEREYRNSQIKTASSEQASNREKLEENLKILKELEKEFEANGGNKQELYAAIEKHGFSVPKEKLKTVQVVSEMKSLENISEN